MLLGMALDGFAEIDWVLGTNWSFCIAANASFCWDTEIRGSDLNRLPRVMIKKFWTACKPPDIGEKILWVMERIRFSTEGL